MKSATVGEFLARTKVQRQPVLLGRNALIAEIVETIANFREVRTVYLTDESGRLVGRIPLDVLMKAVYARAGQYSHGVVTPGAVMDYIVKEQAEDIMDTEVQTVRLDTPLRTAIDLMVHQALNEIPVVDDKGKPSHVLHILDLLRAYVESRAGKNVDADHGG